MLVRGALMGAAAAAAVTVGAVAVTGDGADEWESTGVRTVTVRSDCPSPVWLSYGPREPVPEDAVSLGSHGATAQPMLEGTIVWLLDGDRKALDRATVDASTATVVVDASCRSIRASE